MDSESSKSDNFQAGRWSEDEQHKFILGVMNFGKDWKKVQEVVKTRTGSQVRSHAQKFFLKITKILKLRKKLLKKAKKYVPSEIQQEFIRRIKKDWITQQTPSEIIAMLDCSQEILNDGKKKNYSAQKNKEQKQNSQGQAKEQSSSSSYRPIQSQQRVVNTSEAQQLKDLGDFKKFRSMNAPVMEQSYQQESYFMQVIRLNIDPLSTGYDFSGFIDFSKPLNNPQSLQCNKRKRSFHLPGDQDNQQKLKRTLENIRNIKPE